jgi:hypothetical protein
MLWSSWPFSSASEERRREETGAPPSPDLVEAKTGGGGQTDTEADDGVETQTALATWNALLEPFKEGILPEKARTDPRVKQLEAKPMTVLGLWQYVPFVAKQSTFRSFFLRTLIPRTSESTAITGNSFFRRNAS